MDLVTSRTARDASGIVRILVTGLISAAMGTALGCLAALFSPGLILHSASLMPAQDAPPPEPLRAASPDSEASRAGKTRTSQTRGLATISLADRQIHYYARQPEGEPTWPGVVMVPWSMGLNDEFKKVVDRLAEEGFFVWALDMYGGRIAMDADKGRELGVLADESETVAVIEAVAAHMKFLPEVGDHRVGVVGADAGARWALLAAMRASDLSAAAVFQPRPILEVDALRRINCPLLALYGDRTAGISVAEIDAFRSALDEAARTAEVKVYEGAAEMLRGSGEGYRPEQAEAAWSLMVAFLKDHL